MSHPSNKVTPDSLRDILADHPLTVAQSMRVEAMREAALAFGQAIFDNVPDCADRSAALRVVREALMWSNSAIANDPQIPPEHAI